jgi:hypothetical protein
MIGAEEGPALTVSVTVLLGTLPFELLTLTWICAWLFAAVVGDVV